MKELLQTTAFQIIAEVGAAKSMYMEAIYAARENEFEKAENLIAEGNEMYSGAHKHHFEVVQKEAQGEDLPFSVIFMHAEDQLLTTEVIRTLAEEMISVRKLLAEK
ncbi:MAG: PTS lactose/cellobiose transporter subunit IIA [Mycoplasmatales bacterium]